GVSDTGILEVFSSENGNTYWVSAQAPSAGIRGDDVIGAATHLTQIQYFRKVSADASLKLVVSQVFFEGIDGDNNRPTVDECPWQGKTMNLSACRRMMWSWVDLDVSAVALADDRELLRTGGFVELTGWRAAWDNHAYTHHSATVPLWSRDTFLLERDFDED